MFHQAAFCAAGKSMFLFQGNSIGPAALRLVDMPDLVNFLISEVGLSRGAYGGTGPGMSFPVPALLFDAGVVAGTTGGVGACLPFLHHS